MDPEGCLRRQIDVRLCLASWRKVPPHDKPLSCGSTHPLTIMPQTIGRTQRQECRFMQGRMKLTSGLFKFTQWSCPGFSLERRGQVRRIPHEMVYDMGF